MAKKYRRIDCIIGEDTAYTEIPESGVIGYFSGKTNGIGFGEIPERTLKSLEEVNYRARNKQEQLFVELGTSNRRNWRFF